MKYFEASFDTIIIRFYLLMAVVIASLFAGVPLLAYLALPIFLSAMLGIKFFRRQLNIAPQKSEMKILNREHRLTAKAA